MHLLPAAENDQLMNTEGDFYRLGVRYNLPPSSDEDEMQCIHLVPASLADFTRRELLMTFFEDTDVEVTAPRATALYSWLLRKMAFAYSDASPERTYLAWNLRLYITRHLLALNVDFVNYDEERYRALALDS